MSSPTDPRARRPLVLLTLLLASSLTVMAGAIIAPSLPLIREHFRDLAGVDLRVRLVLTMPALFIVAGAPVAGWLADRRGRRGVLLGAILGYAVAGSAGAFLPSLDAILLSRALLGIAVAGIMTAVTALLADYFGGEDRARVMGMQAAFMGLGGVVFTALGGVLAGLDWRGPFLVYLLALGIFPLALAVLWEPPRDGTRNRTPESDGGERVPPSLPVIRVLAPVYAVSFLLQLSFYTIPVQLPFRLSEVAGAGPIVAGLAIGTTSLFFSLSSILSARLNRGSLPGTIIVRGFVIAAIGFSGIALAGGPAGIFPALAVVGAGSGLVLPAMSVWLTTEVPAHLRGRALGGMTTAVFLGQFVSPLATQPLLRGWGSGAMYGTVAGTLAVVALVTTVALRPARQRALRG
jgi:MFS family permease